MCYIFFQSRLGKPFTRWYFVIFRCFGIVYIAHHLVHRLSMSYQIVLSSQVTWKVLFTKGNYSTNIVKCTQLFEKDNTSIFITLWKREIFKIMSVEICFVLTVSKYFIRVSSNSEADASELLETMMKGERFIH